MTPFESEGYTKDSKFKTLVACLSTPAGTIVQLKVDDGSDCPFFEPVEGDKVNLCYFLPNTRGEEELEFIVEDVPTKPHIHAECIKAWADGAEIEFYDDDDDGDWCSVPNPSWTRHTKYRVKPQKSQKDIEIEKLEADLLVSNLGLARYYNEYMQCLNKTVEISDKLKELKSNA